MLAEQLEFWGPGTFQQQLDKAYDDFIAYCHLKKMDQSQPPFKESKDFGQNLLTFLLLFVMVQSKAIMVNPSPL